MLIGVFSLRHDGQDRASPTTYFSKYTVEDFNLAEVTAIRGMIILRWHSKASLGLVRCGNSGDRSCRVISVCCRKFVPRENNPSPF